MQLFTHLKTIFRNPIILKPYKRIILLSHMRANTSLLGHLLGSNPEIDGYYELHIGYFSWKSLFRQKLVYFEDHIPKASATFLFDKVLAEEHFVNTVLFDNNDDRVVIMMREPHATITSIIKLYNNVDAQHEYATLEGATRYYQRRLKQLAKLAGQLPGKFLFIEAENLTQKPDEVLLQLTSFLQLNSPLTKEYKVFPKTGKKRVGDSSENISLGVIKPKDIEKIELDGLPPEVMDQYNATLKYLKRQSVTNLASSEKFVGGFWNR